MRNGSIGLAVVCTLAAAAGRAEEAPLNFITTEQLAARAKGAPASWNFTIVDARSRVEYGEGRVPGAINCPASEATQLLPKLVKDRARELIFYCNGPNCTKSQKAARAALALGYKRVLEYNEGLPAWGKAKLPLDGKPLAAFEAPAIAPEALAEARAKPGAPVVIDVRDRVEYDAFHVLGAISMPLDSIRLRYKELPKDREVVISCHAGHQSPIGARLLHSLGRSDLKRLDGGVIAWQQKGLPTESGSLAHR